MKDQKFNARFATVALLCVTLIWGLTFPLIHLGVKMISASWFVVARLLLAILFLFPALWPAWRDKRWSFIKAVFWLGFFDGGCYYFQTVGLYTTDSVHSAFLTAFSVVLTPIISPLFGLNKMCRKDMLACLLCAVGVFFLMFMHSGQTAWHGDLWTLLSAVFYAISVNLLQRISHRYHESALAITSWQILCCLPMPVLGGFVVPQFVTWHFSLIAILFFCGVIATTLTIYMQAKFQRYVSVTKAAVIYSFEPLFATLFATLLEGQVISWPIAVGGSLMIAGLLFAGFSSNQ